MYHEHPRCAMEWYVTHLGARMPQGRGGRRGARRPRAATATPRLYAPPTWPSFAKTGFVRDPAGGVNFDDISISIRPWPGGGLVSTRGKIVRSLGAEHGGSRRHRRAAETRKREVPRRDSPVGQLARGDDRGAGSHRDRDRRGEVKVRAIAGRGPAYKARQAARVRAPSAAHRSRPRSSAPSAGSRRARTQSATADRGSLSAGRVN